MSDKTAVVLGGTSGIGLATAVMLSARGAQVHVTGRDQGRLDAVREKYPDIEVHSSDGRSRDAAQELFASIGSIDWLVLALSGGAGAGPLASLDLDALRGAFDAKFWAQLTSAQVALPHLAPDGSITFIGAASARSSIPGTAGLAAVNGAIEAMVKPLAVELAPIRVNAVSPGITDTPWWSGMPAEMRDSYFEQARTVLPVRRIASPDDVAESVVLVATNPNLTGTVIESDGGGRLVPLG